MNTQTRKHTFRNFVGVAVIAAASLTGMASFGSVANAAPSGPSGGHPSKEARFQALTDTQKTCLANAGLSRPTGRPTAEQGAQLLAAAKQCGIEIPANVGGRPSGTGPGSARFAQLTDAQRSCLTNAGLSRPTTRPTAATFQQVREAAAKCGITIPAGAGARG